MSRTSSPTNVGPLAASSTTEDLLFPHGLIPARDNAEAKHRDTGWIGLLSRLLPHPRRLRPARAPSQSMEQSGWKPLQFDGPWATLRVEPGIGSARYWLTLRLKTEMPGDLTDRAIEVREHEPDGIIWLMGRTDKTGVIQAVWAYPGLDPRDRPFAKGLRIVGREP